LDWNSVLCLPTLRPGRKTLCSPKSRRPDTGFSRRSSLYWACRSVGRHIGDLFLVVFTAESRVGCRDARRSATQCEVELKSFSTSFFPCRKHCREGLVLKRKERSDLPPLASVRKFSVSVDWLGLLRQPRPFGQVRLEGLGDRNSAPPETGPGEEENNKASPFWLDEVFRGRRHPEYSPCESQQAPTRV